MLLTQPISKHIPMDRAHAIAQLLLEIKAVALNVKTPFRYTSGMLSPIYCDNRLIMSYPKKRTQVIDAFIELIHENELVTDSIGGIATAGIPHAAWIADRVQKPMLYIRIKAKDHGKKNQIEGRLDAGQRVLVVEDLVSTGGTSVRAGLAVREAGGVVTDCVAIFTYQMKTAAEQFAKAQIRLHTLSNFTALMEVAASNGTITAQEKEIALEWNTDPQGWGKKMGFE